MLMWRWRRDFRATVSNSLRWLAKSLQTSPTTAARNCPSACLASSVSEGPVETADLSKTLSIAVLYTEYGEIGHFGERGGVRTPRAARGQGGRDGHPPPRLYFRHGRGSPRRKGTAVAVGGRAFDGSLGAALLYTT